MFGHHSGSSVQVVPSCFEGGFVREGVGQKRLLMAPFLYTLCLSLAEAVPGIQLFVPFSVK